MAEHGRGADGDAEWWKRAVVYQVFPMSFQDSSGDGVGDLRGILDRLDHLTWLGVDVVWLSPVCPSPMLDGGYDVADLGGIDPVFGTMEDFDELVGALHARGIRLVMDFVPNHTSDRHPWFVESRASRDGPRRDWYVWADPGRRSAEQLAEPVRRQRLGVRRGHRPVLLLPRLPRGAARPQLAQPRGAARHARRAAVLDAALRRRLPRRR
jgi:hypothetical protein